MSLKILEIRIMFESLISTKTAQNSLRKKLAKIRTSIALVINLSVPKVVQLVYRYRTKIETSIEQALVPIYKHIQTIENSKNIDKKKKKKDILVFWLFVLKILKKLKYQIDSKFMNPKIHKPKHAVGQNRDKLWTTTSSKSYLLLFLIELFPNDFSLNCSLSCCMSSLTFRSMTLA